MKMKKWHSSKFIGLESYIRISFYKHLFLRIARLKFSKFCKPIWKISTKNEKLIDKNKEDTFKSILSQ